MKELVKTITVGIFAFALVRITRDRRVAAPQRHWRWEIRARRVDRRGLTYVYAPVRWGETVGEESPFRPFNEFSAITAQRLDPERSGWLALCSGCGCHAAPKYLNDRGRHGMVCDACAEEIDEWQNERAIFGDSPLGHGDIDAA